MENQRFLNQLNLSPMCFKEEGRSWRRHKHFFPAGLVDSTALIQENLKAKLVATEVATSQFISKLH